MGLVQESVVFLALFVKVCAGSHSLGEFLFENIRSGLMSVSCGILFLFFEGIVFSKFPLLKGLHQWGSLFMDKGHSILGSRALNPALVGYRSWIISVEWLTGFALLYPWSWIRCLVKIVFPLNWFIFGISKKTVHFLENFHCFVYFVINNLTLFQTFVFCMGI